MSAGASSEREPSRALIRAYFDKRENLVRFVAARTGSYAAAEDLVQELYLRIADRRVELEAASPTALLYRMAINLMLDTARSARRSALRETTWRREQRVDLGGAEVADEPAPDAVVMSRESLARLVNAVAELPPQRQRAFRLHKLEGLSQAETARIMGVSVKAVEQHISAALRSLAEKAPP